jgi:hypothetical protein
MESSTPPFYPISKFFGIWHEHRRGAHWGLHAFYWMEKMILLTNIKVYTLMVPTYKSKMPRNAVILSPNEFDKKLINAAALNPELAKRLVPISAAEPGKNCDQVFVTCTVLYNFRFLLRRTTRQACRDNKMTCEPKGFPIINTCEMLRNKFQCLSCTESYGYEQPAYVVPSHTEHAGDCLFSSQPDQSTCVATHPATIRLCPCVA